MNLFKQRTIEQGAREDARHGLDSVEDRIVAELGPRPKLDSTGNPEHAEFVTALQDNVRIAELREDLVRAEDVASNHYPPILYTAGLAVAVAAEVLGAILIMRALGVRPAERLPLGFALALALIGITAVTAHRTSARASEGLKTNSLNTPRPKRSVWTLLLLLAYSLFVGAIAVVRIQSSTDEDASRIGTVASSLLMLATCLGPAWMAEWLMRKRALAVAAHRPVRMLRRRLRDAERALKRARMAVNRMARKGAAWDAAAARRRAQYRTIHRLESAGGSR